MCIRYRIIGEASGIPAQVVPAAKAGGLPALAHKAAGLFHKGGVFAVFVHQGTGHAVPEGLFFIHHTGAEVAAKHAVFHHICLLYTSLGMGLFGVWTAMQIDWAVRSLVFGVRFLGHKWEKARRCV